MRRPNPSGDRHRELLEALTLAQRQLVEKAELQNVFAVLLDALLPLTGSEFGFVGEVFFRSDDSPRLTILAAVNLAWNDQTRAFYEEKVPEEQHASTLRTLLDAVLVTGHPVLAHDPGRELEPGDLPPGHPPVDSFMGLPFYSGGRLIGVVGLANRPGGYDEAVVDYLSPCLSTCATIISTARLEREREVVVAERVKAERDRQESAERIRAILETVVDGIITIDEKGTIDSFNPAATRIFGYSTDEVLGHNVSTLMPDPDRSRHDQYLARFCAEGDPRIIGKGREVVGLRRDGTTFPMELAVSEFVLDGARRFTGIVRDISERKAIEQMKDEFVSTVSHELRTPLTSIRGSLRLIESGVTGELPEKALEMVKLASSNTERLVRLINDILDLEKIQAGRLEIRTRQVDAGGLVHSTLEGLAAVALQTSISLRPEIEEAGWVWGDEDRLVQVLTNLVSNAIKFSPEGSQVVVRVELGTSGRLRFSIHDAGPGIPAAQLGKLFQKFQQLDGSDARRQGGTGLGLAISKEIVALHDGRIGVRSDVGHGSVFWFEIPAAIAPKVPAATRRESSAASNDRALLLVEDDDDSAFVLSRLLENDGYRVVRAASLKEAEEALQHVRIGAVLLDFGLPDGDGLDLLARMRLQERTREIPVIAVTGRGPSEDGLGAPLLVDWLTKPVDQRRLASALRRALPTTGRRALVVEDDPSARAVVVAQMKELGVECLEAADGRSAIRLARESSPDLLILDVGLPSADGFAVVEALRQGSSRMLPLLVYSGKELSEQERKDLRLGVTRHLVKSRASEQQFLATVRELLSGK